MQQQSTQMSEMNHQLSELKAALRETQTALSNEMYRRPVGAAAIG